MLKNTKTTRQHKFKSNIHSRLSTGIAHNAQKISDYPLSVSSSNVISVYVCQISSGSCLYSANNVFMYSISKTNL